VIDAWYLDAAAVYVPPHDAAAYPPRQGDIFGPIEVGGERWIACQLVHPTCDLKKPKVAQIQVVRVHALSEIPEPADRAAICTGWLERDGAILVAFAHTFFLPPITGAEVDEPLFSNFREVTQVDKGQLIDQIGRHAALTHEARVSFIRRKLYFRYRFGFSSEDVRALEAARIGNDPDFEGPRPAWAREPEYP